METITLKQREILDAIQSHIAATNQSPTIREIGSAVGLRSSCSVQKQVEALERAGKIKRSNFKYRSIEVVGYEKPVQQEVPFSSIPLLGRVAGGSPIEALQDTNPDILSLPVSLLPRFDQIRQQNACDKGKYFDAPLFALTVVGRSMIDVGIDDGDTVIVRRQQTAENGEIIVALVEDCDATVKKYYRENGRVRLQPANDDFEPIYSDNVQVLGKVALSIKRF